MVEQIFIIFVMKPFAIANEKKEKRSLVIVSLVTILLIQGQTLSIHALPFSDQFLGTLNFPNIELPDLQFLLFESWWSDLTNGTLYIRYVVNNTGAPYTAPTDPILLNISLILDNETHPFTYVTQPSFLEPYTWATGETLGGCTQVHLTVKPETLTAIINANGIIPESNSSNNLDTTPVYDGILISGRVTRVENGHHTPLAHVSIIQCAPLSLQTSLYIRFNTSSDGLYTACLSPQQPFATAYQYHLLFTDTSTSSTILGVTPPIRYQEMATLKASFTIHQPQRPSRPLGFPLGFHNFTQLFITTASDDRTYEVCYKFDWGKNSYSAWYGPYGTDHLFFALHQWHERGWYQVRVIGKDVNGQLSEWSHPTFVYII